MLTLGQDTALKSFTIFRLGNKTGITPATNMRRVEDSCLYQTTSELKTRVGIL